MIISLLDLEQSKTKSIIYKALSEERKKTTKWTCKTTTTKEIKFINSPTHVHTDTPTPIHKQKNNTYTHFDASYENAEFDTILRTWRANKFKMHIIVVKKSNFDEVKAEIRRIREKHT